MLYEIGWKHARNDRALKHASDSCTCTHALHVFHLGKLLNDQCIQRTSRVRTNCYSRSASRPFSTTASNLSTGRGALFFKLSATNPCLPTYAHTFVVTRLLLERWHQEWQAVRHYRKSSWRASAEELLLACPPG